MKHWKLLAFAALLALVGCSSQTQTAQSGLVLSGVVQGSATLLTMNGQPLDLAGARVSVDGETASASAVQPGVEISGNGNDNGGRFKMSQVEVRYRAKGAVDLVDTTNNLLEVVGLRAKITTDTVLVKENTDGTRTPITLADLKAGDFVKVSGLPQADDSIVATRVELKTEDNPNKVELRLRVRDLNPTAKTFTYGLKTYSVDFSTAQVLGTLVEGGFVRVKGTKSGNIVTAQQVRTAEKPEGPTGTRIELKGVIAGLDTTLKTFKIEGLTVDYTNAEVRGSLADGAVVEVRGTLEGTTVKALRVQVRGSGDDKGDGKGARLEGAISSFNSTARTLVINGITVTVDAQTKYEDGSVQTSGGDGKGQELTADAFWGTDRTGKKAEVKGTPVDASTVLATKIELE